MKMTIETIHRLTNEYLDNSSLIIIKYGSIENCLLNEDSRKRVQFVISNEAIKGCVFLTGTTL